MIDPKRNAELNAAEIETRCESIMREVWRRAGNAKDWADVGSLNHVLEMVKEIENFLEGKG